MWVAGALDPADPLSVVEERDNRGEVSGAVATAKTESVAAADEAVLEVEAREDGMDITKPKGMNTSSNSSHGPILSLSLSANLFHSIFVV